MGEQREFTSREKSQGEAFLVLLGLVVAGIVWLVWGLQPAIWTFIGVGLVTTLIASVGSKG